MKVLNLFKIAWKALLRNKVRAFLTMLGIIIGVSAVIAMVAIGQGSKESIEAQISEMGSNLIYIRPENDRGGVRVDRSTLQSLTLKDVEALRKGTTLLGGITPTVSGRGQVIFGASNWPTGIEGVGPDFTIIRKMEVTEGVMFGEREVQTAAKVAVLGKTVVDNLFPNGENPIGKTIRFNKIPFKVIGVLAPKGENTWGRDQDDIVIAPYTTVQKRILAIDHIQSIYASALNEEVAKEAAEEMTEIMRRSHNIMPGDVDDFEVRTQEDLIQRFSSTSEMMTGLLAAIAGISLLVGGIGIMNIMYVSVTERTREIGLRMAIGAKGSDILMQFLIEAILISLAGGLIGAAIGVGAAAGISALLKWPTSVSTSSIVISFLVCVVTGVFFGWYPAKKAASLDPIDALRYE